MAPDELRPTAAPFGPIAAYWTAMIRPVYALPGFLASCMLLSTAAMPADDVPVRHTEGRIRGFLVLRDQENNIIATGSSTQLANGPRVTNDLLFQFKDGSMHRETTVFLQRRTFRLLSYHLIQKGRAFKHDTDMTVNASTGQVVVNYTEDDGKPKTATDHLTLPPDLANGMVSTLLSDIDPKAPKTTLSMVVSTPKPRIVKLDITPEGEDPFSIGPSVLKATRFDVKVVIGGVAGVVAPVVGKQPPDTYVWVMGGEAPQFLRADGPMFDGGPIWRIELASPVWPKNDSARK